MPATLGESRTTRAQITEFLNQRRFAAIGLSRNPQDFTRSLVRAFQDRGYEVVPVNPAVTEIDGHPCFARVQDVEPRVSAALVLTATSASYQVVRDCADAGVTDVWLYRGGGVGAVSPEAVAFCRERGINAIVGECPFMFFPKTGLPHRVHGFVRKIMRTYPK
jgi:uncharacterized protein